MMWPSGQLELERDSHNANGLLQSRNTEKVSLTSYAQFVIDTRTCKNIIVNMVKQH